MKTKICIYFIVLLFIILNNYVHAQSWKRIYYENLDSLNFYQVQKDFYKYWEGKEKTIQENKFREGENEYTFFKGWEYYWKDRINHDGSFPKSQKLLEERNKYFTKNSGIVNSSANWHPILSANANGVGRIDCIAINPIDSSIIWAGSPSGGLWKSIDGGQTWASKTDSLANLSISDIVINPIDPSIMYLAMGDRSISLSSTIGVLKSSDEGNTWQTTGFTYSIIPLLNSNTIKRLVINPNNPDVLYAATSYDGVWKTFDAGLTWSHIITTGYFQDIALQPNNPSTVYAVEWNPTSGTIFHKSTDSGFSFSSIILLSSTTFNRTLLATTLADPNYVYALIANIPDYNGLYLSTNAGNSFNLQSNSPNILGYSCSNPPTGDGLGTYAIALCVSPVNKNLIYVGGISIWKSSNAGISWTISGCWNYATPHADQHYLIFSPFNSNTIYSGNDGGINVCYNLNDSWINITHNLQAMQTYTLGSSITNQGKIVTGTQDNGTQLYQNSSSWSRVLDGDGSDCAIDYSDDNIIYGSLWAGGSNYSILRSTNGGTSFNSIQPTATTHFAIDPSNPQVLYTYKQYLYKSSNRGGNWSIISLPNPDHLESVKRPKFSGNNSALVFILASNTSTAYAEILKFNTITGGKTIIPSPSSIFPYGISNFVISNLDTNKIWAVSRAGFKIFQTLDGGLNWIDVSGSLPEVAKNEIVFEGGLYEGLYIGTDVGVFYKNNTMSDWIRWMDGLPNVIINELEILPSFGKIRAATFGRGIWEGDLASLVGIDEIKTNFENISIYPTPTSDILNIDGAKLANGKCNILIANILGQSLRETESKIENNSLQTQLDIHDLAKGIYLLSIISENSKQTFKVMKN